MQFATITQTDENGIGQGINISLDEVKAQMQQEQTETN